MYRSTSEGATTPAATAAAAAAAASAAAASRGEHGERSGDEMRTLAKLCMYMFLTNLFQAVLPITSFAYAGHLTDATSLAGLGLGISVCNVTGVCIFYGMGSGIDVLCTQAFGAKEQRMVGVTFARGTLLTAFLFVPVAFLWYDMERILLSIGQQPNVAHITGTFARAYLWGMIPFTVFENLKRCLQAQNLVMPVMKVTLLGVLANVLFHHVTMVFLGMGVYGAGLALSLTGMFLLVTLIAYIRFFRLGEGCWSGLCSKEIFHDWPKYLAESVPGLMGLFIEWTSVEASTFLAGLLGDKQLATQIMILSAYAIVFQFSLSVNIGASIRVGNHLGAGNPEGARKAAWCGVRLALVAAATAALGLGFGRGQWPRLYNVSEEVLDKIVDLTPIYVVAQMIDMVQNVCTGILKGMGKQRIQAIAAFVGFWVVGVPLSAYLGVYLGWGVKGLWGGMAAGEGPLLLFYVYVLSSTDWDQCARDAAERVNSQPAPASSPSDSALASRNRSNDLSDLSDSDSDSDSAGGSAATAALSGANSEDEEMGLGYGSYGGGAIAMVRAVSGGERAEADVGESSKLVSAVVVPRRSGSGSTSSGSSGGGGDGLTELHAGERSRLVPSPAGAAHFGGGRNGGVDLIV